MTDLAAIKERYDDIIRRLDAPKMGNPKYLTDRVQIEGELRSLTRKLLALLADTPSVEPLDVERLARALSFAHPGPWPGKLSSAEFARVVAGAYEHGYEAGKLPCTFHRPYDSMCGKTEDDPIHPGPDERMGRGRHVYRHDPVEYAALPTQASDSRLDLTDIPAADMTPEQYRAWMAAGHPAKGPLLPTQASDSVTVEQVEGMPGWWFVVDGKPVRSADPPTQANDSPEKP